MDSSVRYRTVTKKVHQYTPKARYHKFHFGNAMDKEMRIARDAR
jgi:hypothetical protein